MENKRNIIVTAALPYVNGDIHIGHLVEYIQTDIFVRFQKLRGNDCIYICADDTHGAPIMIEARKRNKTPEELIEHYHARHIKDFSGFSVGFDNFHTTHSKENKALAELFYLRMKEKGHIEEKEIEQLFCEKDKMFLPDRFVRGTCPKCGAEDQYGDSCESCSATYNPIDLVNCGCSLCGSKPVTRKSTHYFFKLTNFESFLREWTGPEHIRPELRKKLNEWFEQGLIDWDITRDAPYFGFQIPGSDDKYFYVWHDAPIGYIASTQNWAEKNGKTLETTWQNEDTEIYHFIGKDILYFHTLFWPAMLEVAEFRGPKYVFIHGMLTVNGEKMSKSRGTFVNAETYLKHLDPQYLRWYYAAKLGNGIEDINLSLEDFRLKVNSDLVGKIANIASRVGGMLFKKLDATMGTIPEDAKAMLQTLQDAADEIAGLFEETNYSFAVKKIIELAALVNRYTEEKEPWQLIKTDPEATRGVITAMLNAFKILTIYMKPILPQFAADVELFLNTGELTWQDLTTTLENHQINKFEHLVKRVEEVQVDKMIEESKTVLAAATKKTPVELGIEPLAPECTIDDFVKVDLRAAKVIEVSEVEGADKLLRLKLDLGFETRQVFAGIKMYYKPEDLLNKMVICVANLKPRKMKFGMSEGMVCCASTKDSVHVLFADKGATVGMRVH